jgi:hypothetical protein
MKRALLSGIVLFSFIFQANGQLLKNTWLAGGSVFYTNTESINDPGTISEEEFKLSPNVGFFIANKFAAGIRVAYAMRKSEYKDQVTGNTSYTDITKVWELGPYVRYYFLKPDKLVNLFADGFYSYGIRKNNFYSEIEKSNNYSIGAGPVIYFNPNVGLELMLGYTYTTYQNSDIVYNNFFVNIGFQIHLKK